MAEIESDNKLESALEKRIRGLKAIFVFGSLELGGAERQGIALAQWLREQCDVSVEIWGIGKSGRLSSICEGLAIPWRALANPLSGNGCEVLSKILRFALLLRHAGADILLPYTTGPNISCGLTWRLAGAKLCVWNQRDEGLERHRPLLEKMAVRSSSVFVANSRGGARFLCQELRVHPAQVHVIHNGIVFTPPVADRVAWRQCLGAAADSMIVCMVANLSDKKDHVTLLHAWKRVVGHFQKAPKYLKLILAGRFDSEMERIKGLVAELEIGEYVCLHGETTDVAGLLGASDVGVYSSKSEGLPNGVLECMASGLPVVATDIPGIRELLGDGYPFLSLSGNHEAMAHNLIGLINDGDLRLETGANNRRRALNCFSHEHMCSEMEKLIEKNCSCV